MKNIWLNSDELKGKECYIYGDGYNAKYTNKVLEKNGINVTGFVKAYDTENNIDGKPVVSLDYVKDGNSLLILTQRKQMNLYDALFGVIDDERIYTTANVLKSEKCIFCDNENTVENGADFAMFLRYRMFGGKNVKSAIVHCPKCRIYYSKYRPSDEEMGLLYKGYRDEVYYKERHGFEPNYSKELNDNLSSVKDVYGRKEAMYNFMKDEIDGNIIKTVVDYGGDRGQFIPDEFADKRRIVYDISGVSVVDGVELITDYEEIKKCRAELVLCNQVLEHLSDVREYLLNLYGIVENKGFIYIEVPYERWCVDEEYVHFHEHINYFCEQTFIELIKFYQGLSIIKMETSGYSLKVLIKKNI